MPSQGPTNGDRPPRSGSSPTKKATSKKVSKKRVAKKVATKKATSKKRVAKKATTRKATSKKSVAKKATSKKRVAKKAASKKTSTRKTSKAAPRRASRRSRAARPMIGWREWVVLPAWSTVPIKAKVDTGAVTSSIHAFDLELVAGDHETIARFGVAPRQGSHAEITWVEHPVIGFKKVKSSNGQTELRPVVTTTAIIGGESFEIDITLASRDDMGFRMLLGRKAVRNRFMVDPGRSFLQPASDDTERG